MVARHTDTHAHTSGTELDARVSKPDISAPPAGAGPIDQPRTALKREERREKSKREPINRALP